MNDISVKYKYANQFWNGVGEPIEGDIDTLTIDISGQIFKEANVFVWDLKAPERERFAQFGRMLQRMGKEIELQATKGKPTEIITYDGTKSKTF